ncbi:hypothetical protein EDB84DRAFT_1447088 [Lactarius hengduanensis]|nr:hypothetical protein EDB84DRAFT_1447088 [Lactarius hengduanensis]
MWQLGRTPHITEPRLRRLSSTGPGSRREGNSGALDTTKFFPITCAPWILCWATGKPWWDAEAAHLIETLPGVPSAQLVGADNQVAVISDPQNHVFVLKNSGFVAYGVTGSYDVLAIVDQTHFPHAIKDRVAGAILGRSFEAPANSSTRDCVVASLCTRNQVPMSLTLYLKRELDEPFKLAVHGSSHIVRILPSQCQTEQKTSDRLLVLVDYSSMVKQHPIGGDSVENSESSSQFLDALRTHATDDLHTAALEYGTIPHGLAAIHRRDRQHDGQADQVGSGSPGLGRLHANETLITPQNVDHENSNKVKQEEGVLSVARIKAQARTDADAYSTVAERTRRSSQWRRWRFSIKARADAEVADEFAQETSRRRQEIQRIAAFGHKAVFVPTEVMDVVLAGMVAGVGVDLRT